MVFVMSFSIARLLPIGNLKKTDVNSGSWNKARKLILTSGSRISKTPTKIYELAHRRLVLDSERKDYQSLKGLVPKGRATTSIENRRPESST